MSSQNMRDYQRATQALVAGLKLLREHARIAGLPPATMDLIYHAESRIADEMPPWEPEHAPAAERPWSQVTPGDEVQAPNGQWYPVDAWARIGEQVKVLLVGPAGTIPSVRRAKDTVPTRRGATGQAIDIFRAGGLDLEQMRTEKAA